MMDFYHENKWTENSGATADEDASDDEELKFSSKHLKLKPVVSVARPTNTFAISYRNTFIENHVETLKI